MKETQQIMELNQLRDSLYIKFYIKLFIFIAISVIGTLIIDGTVDPNNMVLKYMYIYVSVFLLISYTISTLYFFTYIPNEETKKAKYKNLKGLRYDLDNDVIYYSYGMSFRQVNYIIGKRNPDIDTLYKTVVNDKIKRKNNVVDLENE